MEEGMVVPMPMTAHPELIEAAALVRELMGRGSRYVQLVDTESREATADDSNPFGRKPPIITMTVKRHAGFAPYVGEPFVWMWDVAFDDDGRFIAGEARQEHRRVALQ